MIELHNSAIKKDASIIFETNALNNKTIDKVNEFIQPVVEVQPTELIHKFTSGSQISLTIYTTPTDYLFYLKDIVLNCSPDSAGTTVQITFTDYNDQTFNYLIWGAETSPNNTNIHFPFKGLKLKKNSNIIVTCENGFCAITGYKDSDRS